jgi:hypothetical protein
MRLHRLESGRPPLRRPRFAGVGLAMLGAVGLGLAVVPACGGGGGVGDDVAHLAGATAHVTVAYAAGSVAPDCGGGGTGGDD